MKEKNMVTFDKKKFRFSDWLAEKIIKAVAFLSIAVVILIFIFVFREAFPIFKMDKKSTAPTETLVQESYGSTEAEPLPAITAEKPVPGKDENQVIIDKPSSTLLSNTWMPVSDNPRFGIWPLFLGTFKVTLIALLFAAPNLNSGCNLHFHVCKTAGKRDNKACDRTSCRISIGSYRVLSP